MGARTYLGYPVVRLRLDQVSYGHSPDLRKRLPAQYARLPITVNEYHMVADGSQRLWEHEQDGKKYIDAIVVKGAQINKGCALVFIALVSGLVALGTLIVMLMQYLPI